jgi:hypothetical protein
MLENANRRLLRNRGSGKSDGKKQCKGAPFYQHNEVPVVSRLESRQSRHAKHREAAAGAFFRSDLRKSSLFHQGANDIQRVLPMHVQLFTHARLLHREAVPAKDG